MSDRSRTLAAECAAALAEYLADPREEGLSRAYEIGRRALTLEVGVAELGIAHGNVLATALPGAGTPEERAQLTQRAAEFLGETMAPLEMVLRGYREANAQLQRLNETLEQRVRERTAALQASEERYRELSEELKRAGRRKDEFLALLAHELRNPLAPLRNALQILRLTRYDPAEVEQSTELMERQVQHLVRLIEDLMDVSRITRGKVELRRERLQLAMVIERALEISRPPVEAAGHELTVEVPREPVVVHADAARLTQVVANLLNNAAKYTEPGGHIWLTAEARDGQAMVRVRDTGIGIPAAMLPDIFDMFVQVPSAQGRAQGGLGMGLTLVKSLVELHGGSVEAHSDGPGRGSEFVVRLPLAADRRASPAPASPADEGRPASPPATLRLLVVDDHQESANSLGMLMKLAGYDVRVVYNGPAALESARSFGPQIVLQDIHMPGMNGYEVARHLRAEPATTDVLLVAVTGYGSDEDRRRTREAGFDHHLVKPVDWSALQKVLATVSSHA